MSSSFERREFADQLSIETPEQVALEFQVAGIGSRFVALLLDQLIQAAALFILGLLVVAVMAAAGVHGEERLSNKWFQAGVTFLVFLILWGYFALFEAFWHGQTPGKRVMKLRVIKDNGRQITLFESLTRNLLRFVDDLPSPFFAVTPALGIITMLANKRNKRLGDLAAGTLVVHERADAQPLLWTGAAPQRASANRLFAPSLPATSLDLWQLTGAAAGMFPADAVARLSGDDLVVIEAFFARALDLPLETRATMAHRILGALTGQMGVAPPVGNPERALEAIAVGLRSQGRRP